jgi:hypothetical protein
VKLFAPDPSVGKVPVSQTLEAAHASVENKYPTRHLCARSISSVTDEELVLLAKDGDGQAFDQLVQRHESAVFRVCLVALRVREDAEEAAQDAFIRAWRSIKGYREEAG